jgi:hypothetical protein
MTTKDKDRKWMWCFLAALVTLPFYFVQQLVAAFALFAIGFATFVFAIVGLYMLQKGWEMAVSHVVDSERLAERGYEARRPARWMP